MEGMRLRGAIMHRKGGWNLKVFALSVQGENGVAWMREKRWMAGENPAGERAEEWKIMERRREEVRRMVRREEMESCRWGKVSQAPSHTFSLKCEVCVKRLSVHVFVCAAWAKDNIFGGLFWSARRGCTFISTSVDKCSQSVLIRSWIV